ALADRFRNLAGLADREADPALAVANDDKRREREPLPALDDLCHAVDPDDGFFEALVVAIATTVVHQNSSPASRAAVARAATRPWYFKPEVSNTTELMPRAL